LNGVHHIQGGPTQDVHHGGGALRMRQSSSRNCTFRVRRNPVATFQWPRTRPEGRSRPPSYSRCGSVRRVVGLDLPFRSVSQQLKDHIIVRYQE
jgi:hypothetical protein